MGFRSKKIEEVTAQGKYVVEHVPVLTSGKKLLQLKLDQGDKKGWKLIELVNIPKKGWLLIVWERQI